MPKGLYIPAEVLQIKGFCCRPAPCARKFHSYSAAPLGIGHRIIRLDINVCSSGESRINTATVQPRGRTMQVEETAFRPSGVAGPLDR